MLINVSIVNNTARYGAGLISGGGGALRCEGCTIAGNAADHYGGGVLGGGGLNEPTFVNSAITNNVAIEEARFCTCRAVECLLTCLARAGRRPLPLRHHARHHPRARAAAQRQRSFACAL